MTILPDPSLRRSVAGIAGALSVLSSCSSPPVSTPITASDTVLAPEAPSSARERRAPPDDVPSETPDDGRASGRSLADLGQDATLCDVLDSRLTAQVAPLANGVSLLITTDTATLVDVVRLRASRFAGVTQEIAVDPSVPEIEADEGREALVGVVGDEVEVEPTAGTDLVIPVTVEVQDAPRGAMLLIIPAEEAHVGDVTAQIQRTLQEAEAGGCDGPHRLPTSRPEGASSESPSPGSIETTPIDEGARSDDVYEDVEPAP